MARSISVVLCCLVLVSGASAWAKALVPKAPAATVPTAGAAMAPVKVIGRKSATSTQQPAVGGAEREAGGKAPIETAQAPAAGDKAPVAARRTKDKAAPARIPEEAGARILARVRNMKAVLDRSPTPGAPDIVAKRAALTRIIKVLQQLAAAGVVVVAPPPRVRTPPKMGDTDIAPAGGNISGVFGNPREGVPEDLRHMDEAAMDALKGRSAAEELGLERTGPGAAGEEAGGGDMMVRHGDGYTSFVWVDGNNTLHDATVFDSDGSVVVVSFYENGDIRLTSYDSVGGKEIENVLLPSAEDRAGGSTRGRAPHEASVEKLIEKKFGGRSPLAVDLVTGLAIPETRGPISPEDLERWERNGWIVDPKTGEARPPIKPNEAVGPDERRAAASEGGDSDGTGQPGMPGTEGIGGVTGEGTGIGSRVPHKEPTAHDMVSQPSSPDEGEEGETLEERRAREKGRVLDIPPWMGDPLAGQ